MALLNASDPGSSLLETVIALAITSAMLLVVLVVLNNLFALSRKNQASGRVYQDRQELIASLRPLVHGILVPPGALGENVFREDQGELHLYLPTEAIHPNPGQHSIRFHLADRRLLVERNGREVYRSSVQCRALSFWTTGSKAETLGLAIELDVSGAADETVFLAFGSLPLRALP